MKISIEATTRIVLVKTCEADEGIKCRLWEGETEHGVKVEVLIPRIAAKVGQDLSQFEDELQECRPPSADSQCFPLRLIL